MRYYQLTMSYIKSMSYTTQSTEYTYTVCPQCYAHIYGDVTTCGLCADDELTAEEKYQVEYHTDINFDDFVTDPDQYQ